MFVARNKSFYLVMPVVMKCHAKENIFPTNQNTLMPPWLPNDFHFRNFFYQEPCTQVWQENSLFTN